MTQPLVTLDGSKGEGGGQILRSSLALSLLTGRPFHLRRIRAGRKKPGLQPQHLASVLAAGAIGQAEIRGASLNSTELNFLPGEVVAGDYRFPIGTAGATGLALQTVYLPLSLRGSSPSSIILEGGTHVSTSPCFHFLDLTWRAYLKLVGITINLTLKHPGFYPKGGGRVEAHLEPCPRLAGLQLEERTAEPTVSVLSAVAGLPRTSSLGRPTVRPNDYERPGWTWILKSKVGAAVGARCWASRFTRSRHRHSSSAWVRLGKPAETVADEAVDQALAYLGAAPAAVDPHSADQLVLPLAFAEGPSTFTVSEVTSHLLTNVAVIGQFLEREIVVEGELGSPGVVRIAGNIAGPVR